MIAKKYKLPIQNFVGKSAKIIRTPTFVLKIFPTNNSFSRFGLVVSGKAVNKATERNRIKRIVYNLCQEEMLKIKMNDYLIIINKDIVTLSDEQIKKDFKKLFLLS